MATQKCKVAYLEAALETYNYWLLDSNLQNKIPFSD